MANTVSLLYTKSIKLFLMKPGIYAYFSLLILFLCFAGCTSKIQYNRQTQVNSNGQQVYQDSFYIQNFSIKYYFTEDQLKQKASAISCNRDGQIRILLGNKLIVPDNGSLFYSGKLVQDVAYTQMLTKQIRSILTYQNQTVYLDQKQIFWNPEYVNKFPTNVGDRKICSSNIIAFLQTAYHFTKNEKYKNKAFELMEKFGYLDNLMRPMKQIGPSDNDPVSKSLSEEWNHSDDEMYFLAYWGLYLYAFNPELKEKFREAIRDHWNIERPERNALWNFTYAMTGAKDFDLEQSIGFLKNYPIDLRNWIVKNSQRKDIELIPDNFRGQTTKELLPLNEIPLYRHNGQIFALDSDGDGNSLISAGDVWLLPYWMGRYIGVISAPIRNNSKN